MRPAFVSLKNISPVISRLTNIGVARPLTMNAQNLSDEQRKVMLHKGTEQPFSSPLNYNKQRGIYKCGLCKQELFSSDNKYDSGSGWPSFDAPVLNTSLVRSNDLSLAGQPRVEIACSRCKSHIGHVFDDGPRQTTGQRYCTNGVALDFEAR